MQPQSPFTATDQGDHTQAPASPAGASSVELPMEVQQLAGALRLLTGETVKVRALRPDDTERLQAFHTHLSPDSIVFRFFHYLPALPFADAERFTHLDYRDRMALVAIGPVSSGVVNETDQTAHDDGVILGVVRYDRIGPAIAEVAFVVEDRWQGHGIATALLYRLAAYARAHGITQFLAITLAANKRMLAVLQHAGYPLSIDMDDGEAEVTLDISRSVSGEPAAVATEHGAYGTR